VQQESLESGKHPTTSSLGGDDDTGERGMAGQLLWAYPRAMVNGGGGGGGWSQSDPLSRSSRDGH